MRRRHVVGVAVLATGCAAAIVTASLLPSGGGGGGGKPFTASGSGAVGKACAFLDRDFGSPTLCLFAWQVGQTYSYSFSSNGGQWDDETSSFAVGSFNSLIACRSTLYRDYVFGGWPRIELDYRPDDVTVRADSTLLHHARWRNDLSNWHWIRSDDILVPGDANDSLSQFTVKCVQA